MQINQKKNERVTAYIDGFNLYFGMLEAGYNKFKWLDINKLILSLLQPNQTLIDICYFTSRVRNNPSKEKRQSTFIEALESVDVKVIYGNYQANVIKCQRCGHAWNDSKEKMTDVNIATQMIVDAYNDKYDMAMLVSGDSDLVPPINSIHQLFPHKRVFLAFPPARKNNSVAAVAKGHMTIGRNKLLNAQFPSEVVSNSGYMLKKPDNW